MHPIRLLGGLLLASAVVATAAAATSRVRATLATLAEEDTGHLFDVRRFGAKGDGKALDTAAIQRAMDACAATPGGGVVRFRSGKSFRIQSLQLPARALGSRDVMEMRIERGATLLVDDNRSAWPKGRNVFQGTNVT